MALAMVVGLLGVGPAGAATELTLSPANGPPGTQFVITGTGFADLPVEIRWGDLSGPVIARATGPAFSVTAEVPDSPPNSHPVLAVVTDGTSVSTSSASFQVTTGEAPPPAPEETTPSTSTTVAEMPVTSPTASIPGGESGRPAATAPATGRGGGLSGGVDGGVDGGSAGDAGGAPSAGAGSGSTDTSTVTTVAAGVGDATIPTVTPAPGAVSGSAPTEGQGASNGPVLPGDGVAAAALAPARTNQSAGAVSNPALLFLGLALVFGGGVFLAVRNRHRA